MVYIKRKEKIFKPKKMAKPKIGLALFFNLKVMLFYQKSPVHAVLSPAGKYKQTHTKTSRRTPPLID